MKIEIDKIVEYKVNIVDYFSDDIFSFTLQLGDLLSERRILLKEKLADESSKVKMFLTKELIQKGLVEEQLEELMNTNLEHIYGASKYYTNGQKLISTVLRDNKYELAIHKNLLTFTNYFYNSPMFSQFSIQNLRVKKYDTKEKAETVIMNVLSKLEVTRIPTEFDSDRGFLEIRKVHPSTNIFSIGQQTIKRETQYDGDWIDKITNEVIDQVKPRIVKCCINCKHFKFSGMSHDMSGGFTGYCFLIRDKLEEKSVEQSTTNIWSWCSEIEIK